MKHLILGVGAAGIQAAKTIRSLAPNDEIVMVSADETVNSRCMLHHYISGQRNEQTMSFVPESFFEEMGIQWIKGTRVKAIHPETKTVELEGDTIGYDKLLIATGANSIMPPIGALNTAGNVFGMRHLLDGKRIAESAAGAKKAVVIGAGLVGLDAAYGLMELNQQVTVVEMAQQVLPLNLDRQAAKTYQDLFEQEGCQFYLNTKVVDTRQGADGNITQVLLDNGVALDCDYVVVAAGVRPALECIEGSGIEHQRGILVDAYQQTNLDDIYAAGDVTGLAEIWPSATHQGEVAAKNMCGVKDELPDLFAYKNTVNFFGLVTLAIGDSTFKDGGDAVVREDRNNYQKYVTRDNKVTGVVLQGDISHSGIWQYLIKNQVDISKLNKPVWKLTYADFYQVEPDGEYRWPVS